MPGPTRRTIIRAAAATAAAMHLPDIARARAAAAEPFRLRYLCASAMFGTMSLAEVLPCVRRVGSTAIDIWPRVHGNYVEQIRALGTDRFAEMLREHEIMLGGIACYRYGPLGLDEPMKLARDIGAQSVTFVVGSGGPKNLEGDELKRRLSELVEKMKPIHSIAAERGHVIAVENHVGSLLSSPDSIKHFADYSAELKNLGIAFAPHHLGDDAALHARLIREAGPAVKFFYAQQHGKGSHHKQPKADELLQMPGRGVLDFGPHIRALREIGFAGYTEIFMHPFPRGVPILETADAIVDEINRSRRYLDSLVAEPAL